MKCIQSGHISGHGKQIQDEYDSVAAKVGNHQCQRLRRMWGGRRDALTKVGCDTTWFNSFRKFAEYVITLPGWDDDSLEIDRIDNNKGYEPGNIRFVTKTRNIRNRKTTRKINGPNGESLVMMDVLEAVLRRKIVNGEAVYQRAVWLSQNRVSYEKFIETISKYK